MFELLYILVAVFFVVLVVALILDYTKGEDDA